MFVSEPQCLYESMSPKWSKTVGRSPERQRQTSAERTFDWTACMTSCASDTSTACSPTIETRPDKNPCSNETPQVFAQNDS